ncbi:MAG: Nramp family divalent metal transporter [Rhodospirillaceae bacterium]|nr:Nramp family divalent metal transporter [Rhodospirillaceae bacterium]
MKLLPARNSGARTRRFPMLAAIGPGLLLAATGVGGGDLATGTFVGSLLGTGLLWAVVVGAFMKYVITEGVARWQLATGNTFLEGVFHKGGPVVIWAFLPYLLLFTFFVGGAQMSACGVALVALFPVFDNPDNGKVVFGIACSAVGVAMVLIGGYRLFEQVMRVCIGVMFVTVVLTAVLLWPGTGVVLRGLLVPTIPDFSGLGLTWTVALIGGIGGTVTMLCYGYWMREEGRTDPDELRVCRVDLGAGYFMTALFGIAMVIIGSTIEIEGQGTTLLVDLADRLEGPLGPWGRWLFLIGAFGAVFSSLLGVWQSVPYIFADCWGLVRERHERGAQMTVDTSAWPYRAYLLLIATVPMVGLFRGFQDVQRLYTVTGALFLPFVTLALLLLNSRTDWVGKSLKNSPWGSAALLVVLLFFSSLAVRTML